MGEKFASKDLVEFHCIEIVKVPCNHKLMIICNIILQENIFNSISYNIFL